jgi:hypothetical protein
MLPERRTGTALGHMEFTPHVLDHGTSARGA